MSYQYATLVDREGLITFRQYPRVLDELEQAIRVIAAIGTVESVGDQQISLLLERIYPHYGDVPEDDNGMQSYYEPHEPFELVVRADAILSINALDDEGGGEDGDGKDEDEEGGEVLHLAGRTSS